SLIAFCDKGFFVMDKILPEVLNGQKTLCVSFVQLGGEHESTETFVILFCAVKRGQMIWA
ncbi:MAG: hypothetical protein N4A65_03360, partial [Cohaesibacter sp.]|nr:hypothetical protein [Cohaesibacter sp.]